MLIRRKSRLSSVALLLLSIVIGNAQAALPAVLQHVPDDASLVFAVTHLQDLSTRLSATATKLNIPVPPDLLGMLSRQIGVTDGFDANGSAAVIQYLPNDQATEPTLILLIPATDSRAMLASISRGDAKFGAPDSSGIAQLAGNDAQDIPLSFAASVGNNKWVAFAPNRAALTQYLAHNGTLDKSLSPAALKSIDANDAFFYANVPQFSAQAIRAVDSFTQMAHAGLQQVSANPKSIAMQQGIIDLSIKGVSQLLTDAGSALITFRINDSGINLALSASFKPESPTGKFVAAQKNLKPASLEGLPAGTLLAAGNFTWDSSSFAALFGQVTDSLFQNPTLADPEFLPFRQSMEIQKQMAALTSSTRFAFYQSDAPTQGLFHGILLTETSDAAKYQDLFAQFAKFNFGGTNPAYPELKTTVTYQDKALTYKQVTLNKYTVSYAVQAAQPGDARSAQALQAQKTLVQIYGTNGTTFFSGSINNQLAITIIGGDEKFAQQAIDAALTHSTALAQAPEIADSAAHTLPNAPNVFYLATPWLAFTRQIIGNEIPKPATPIAPTAAIVVSTSITDSSCITELFVPMSAIMSLSESLRAPTSRLPTTLPAQ